MGKVSNHELLKAVIGEMPEEHQKLMSDATTPDQVVKVFEQYPSTKNAFIDTLVNKVGKTIVFSKVYKNPLKSLKKGTLAYGDSIEELFVNMAQMKNFGEHWTGSTTTEGDLIKELAPVVSALYIKKNFDKKFKTTIKDKDLRKAFFSETGLSDLVSRITSSLENGLNYNEYKYTRDTLNMFIGEGKVLTDAPTGTGDTYSAIPSTALKQELVTFSVTGASKEEKGKNLTELIRATTGNMQFMSDKYNLAQVTTFSNPSDLVLFTTPDTQALLDVNVIASAFNVSATDLNSRTVLVDELPSSITGATPITGKVLAVLCDQDLLQIWDTYQSMGTFNNPEQQYTNYFASAEGIFAICLFANVAVFYETGALLNEPVEVLEEK